MAEQRYDDTTQRVYTRPGDDAGTTQAAPQGDSGEKKGIFSEFSVASVIASSLAAITSFALQKQIGLAGSFIGVGVAAAATAIANQVYNSMISASAEKLKSISDQDATTPAAPSQAGVSAAGAYAPGDAAYGIPADKTMMRPVPTTYATEQDVMPESGTPIAPDSLIRAAAQRRHALIRRRAAISIVIIALVAALLSAGVVLLATAGHGLGSIESLVSPSPRPTPGVTAPTATQQDGGATPTEDGTASEDEAATGATAPEQDATNDATATSGATETSNDGSAGEKTGDSASSETSGTAGSGTGAAEKPSTGASGETATGGAGSQGGAGGSASTGGSSGSTNSGSGSTGAGDAGAGTGTGSTGGSAGSSPSATTTTTNKS